MAQVSSVSHCEAWKPQQCSCCCSHFKNCLGKLTPSSLDIRSTPFPGVFRLWKDCQTNNRQRGWLQERAGCGWHGCIRTFSPSWPLCHAYMLPLLWPNSTDPSIHQGITYSMSRVSAKIWAGRDWRVILWGMHSATAAGCSQISNTFLAKSLSNIVWIQCWSFFEQDEVQNSQMIPFPWLILW